MHLPFFVYGTLKPGESNYRAYLGGRTTVEQPAHIPGAALYTEGMYPYMVIASGVARPSEWVNGVLITVHPDLYTKTLQHIDTLEDYKPQNPWNLYERITHAIQTPEGVVNAWVYVAGPQTLATIRAGLLQKVLGGTWGTRW